MKKLIFKKRRLFIATIIVAISILCGGSVFASQAKVDSKTYTHPSRFSNCIVFDGIDISYWQGRYENINWNKVKRAGIDYAFIRVGYTSTDSSSSYGHADTYFDSSIKGAQDAGIMVGVYYYARPTTLKQAQAEAKWVVNKLQYYDIDLPVIMDYEEKMGSSAAQRTSNALAWLKIIKDAGYEPMFYSYRNLMDNYFNMALIDNMYKVWIAQYYTDISYTGAFEYWQYTSSGTVPGLTGNIDCNFWYYDNSKEVTKDGTTSIKDAEVSLGTTSYTYSGYKKTPAVTVKYNGQTLTSGTDYKVHYFKNVKVGTAYAMVRGKGKFSNTQLVPFSINRKNISGASVADLYTYTYNGQAKTPRPLIKMDTLTLSRNVDYTLSYKDNVSAGTGTLTITGKGNYTGTITRTFKINKGTPAFTGYTSYSRSTEDSSLTLNTKCSSGGNLSYKSDNREVATVDEKGKVTLHHKAGTATITVTSASTSDYESATRQVKITVKDKSPQEITLTKTIYKTYTTTKDFVLEPTASSTTGFTYKSSDPSVASVSDTGIVSVHKMGRAKITVTTKESSKYEVASTNVYIKVYPLRVSVSDKPLSVISKGKVRFRWNVQKGTTYYEVIYSRDKTFAKNTCLTKKVKPHNLSYSTQSATISGLRSNNTYYFKVRAVKEVKNDYNQTLTYYGNWSYWRSLLVK